MEHLTLYLLEKYPLEPVAHWEIEEGEPFICPEWQGWRQASEPVSKEPLTPADGSGTAKKGRKRKTEQGVLQPQQGDETGPKKGAIRTQRGKGKGKRVLFEDEGRRELQEAESASFLEVLLQKEQSRLATRSETTGSQEDSGQPQEGQ